MFLTASKHVVSFVHDTYLFFSKNTTVCNEIFAIALINIILYIYYSISVIFPKVVRGLFNKYRTFDRQKYNYLF